MDNKTKTVSICLNHKWVDGMAERIQKVFPNATHVNMNGKNCVACKELV